MLPRKAALHFKKTPEQMALFLASWLVLDFNEAILAAMKENSVTRTMLAKRLGVSKAYVTKLFRGENVTLRSAARIACAVGVVVDVRLVKFEELLP